jgi:reactive intermediate/imine deaminase
MTKNERRFINPPDLSAPTGYTHVVDVAAGRTLYISGQIAFDRDRNVVGVDDLYAQTEQVFRNLEAALSAAGADFSHVVKLTYYLLDIAQIQVVREVRDRFLNTKNPPASTAVEVRRLVRDDLLIEVDAVAVLPE